MYAQGRIAIVWVGFEGHLSYLTPDSKRRGSKMNEMSVGKFVFGVTMLTVFGVIVPAGIVLWTIVIEGWF